MAISGTPPITISDLVAEFGGPGNLLAYVRGGAYVPDTTTNAGVPTAAPINLLDFLGAQAISAFLQNHTISGAGFGGGSATASVQFNTDGSLTSPDGFDSPAIDGREWDDDTGLAGSNFEVRATQVSKDAGISATGTLGSWLALSSNRLWSAFKASGTGTETWVIDFEIRPAGGGSNLATCRITLSCTISP